MIKLISNLLRDGFGNKIKSHGNYLEDDIYSSEIAREKVVGAKPFSGYGNLVTTGLVTDNLVLPITGITAPLYVGATGIQMQIQSTSPNDTAAGTGIRTVEIHYIDNNGDEQSETITLNGTTPVLTVATDLRFIQCMHLVTVGTGRKAAGDITLTEVSGTPTITYTIIKAGKNRCTSSFRYVPNGKRLMVKAVYGSSTSVTADTTTELSLCTTRIESHDSLGDNILFPQFGISAQNGSEATVLDMPFPISGNTIVGYVASTNKAATITGGFIGYLENE